MQGRGSGVGRCGVLGVVRVHGERALRRASGRPAYLRPPLP